MDIIKQFDVAKKGFIQGLGWSFGVTLGFVLISILIAFILKIIGGLPVVGKWIADIVEVTQKQLMLRNPYY